MHGIDVEVYEEKTHIIMWERSLKSVFKGMDNNVCIYLDIEIK